MSGSSADDVLMTWLPLGLNWGYLHAGAERPRRRRAVLLDRFRPAAALDLVERERVTYIPTAPASLTAILQEPELGRRDLSSLRLVDQRRRLGPGRDDPRLAGRRARRPARAARHAGDRLQTYTRASDDPERVAGSVGRPASHMGLRLIDAELRDVPPGAEGEHLRRRALGASRLSQQSGRQRGGVPAGRLVSQRRPRR